MIITISGHPGAGKSTVGKLLAKKLRYRYFSVGGIRRAMARERGMTLQEFNVLGERNPFTDKEVDAWQRKLGRERDNLVVEGRTSFYFIPHSVKLLFTVNLEEAARRIMHDQAHVRRFEASHHYRTTKELVHGLRQRMASDRRRYRKYYNLNIFDRRHYDAVIDTTDINTKQTLEKVLIILAKVREKRRLVKRMGKKKATVHKSRVRKPRIKILRKIA